MERTELQQQTLAGSWSWRILSKGGILSSPLWHQRIHYWNLNSQPWKVRMDYNLHLFQDAENWRVLIRVESKPEVISMPMQTMKSQRYIYLRLRFLYHGTLSCATNWVTIGSERPSWIILTIVLRFLLLSKSDWDLLIEIVGQFNR